MPAYLAGYRYGKKDGLKHLFTYKRKELFSDISGNDDIKWTLQKAIEGEEPVHILLVGEPGFGKTRFLKAIEKEYPDLSYFALASGSTGGRPRDSNQ